MIVCVCNYLKDAPALKLIKIKNPEFIYEPRFVWRLVALYAKRHQLALLREIHELAMVQNKTGVRVRVRAQVEAQQ
jgi:hypothetical protein